jgi:hypothetical protein
MATRLDAEEAREHFSEALRRKGAHAIGVEKVRRGGATQFGLVAYFDKPPSRDLPETVEITRKGKRVQVPVAVRRQERFKPEGTE